MGKLLLASIGIFLLSASTFTKPVIARLTVEGEIDSDTMHSLAESVAQIKKNPDVKAVILVVQSPGGGVLPSAAMRDDLNSLSIPVIGWCDMLCASGGYYILTSTSVKVIGMRSEETIIGSIGAVSSGKEEKNLVQSGRHKHYTDAEKPYWQALVEKMARRFYDLVEKARGNKITDWGRIKDADVFFGSEGVSVGLADGVFPYEQAVTLAAKAAGNPDVMAYSIEDF